MTRQEYHKQYYLDHKAEYIARAKAYRRTPNGKALNVKWTRHAYLKKTYGISLSEYNTMFALQYGKCAICKRHQTELTRQLAVDHCHTTGKVCGLLCISCNVHVLVALESYGHLLDAAKAYLIDGEKQ